MIIKVRQSNLIDKESSISYLSEHIFNELKLTMDIPYQINVGLRNQETFLKPLKDEKETLYFTPTLLQDLLLFEGIKTNIWLKNNSLYLGPVIGTFVKPQLIER